MRDAIREIFEDGFWGGVRYLLFYSWLYPRLMRLAHRHGWHRVKRIGPLMPGGGYLSKCEWCGLCDTSEANPAPQTFDFVPLGPVEAGYAQTL